MATEIRHRRGTTAQHAAFTGALAEITVDTDKKTAVVHDGGTAGGIPLAREDAKNDGALGYQQDVKTNDYNVVVGDIGKMLVANKATPINFALGTAAALTSKFVAGFKNIGAGTLTITPNGSEQIDGVNAAISVPTGASLILKGDGTSFRTFVSNGDVTASAIHNAATKAALADADELGVVDTAASNVLKKSTLANLIDSIFKTTRKIANAQFLSGSFTLFDSADPTKGLKFDASSVPSGITKTIRPQNVAMMARLQDQKASGTNGGTSVAGAWTTRTINTEVSDPDNIVTLSSNQFTLAANARIHVRSSLAGTTSGRLRIYNVTDGTELALSNSVSISSAYNGSDVLEAVGYGVAGKTYRVDYWAQTALASTGLGSASASGSVEVYTDVIIEGLAA